MTVYSLFCIAWSDAAKRAIETDTHFTRSIEDICRLQNKILGPGDVSSPTQAKGGFSLLIYDQKYGSGLGKYDDTQIIEMEVAQSDLIFSVTHDLLDTLKHESRDHIANVMDAFVKAATPGRRRAIALQRSPIIIPVYFNDTGASQVIALRQTDYSMRSHGFNGPGSR